MRAIKKMFGKPAKVLLVPVDETSARLLKQSYSKESVRDIEIQKCISNAIENLKKGVKQKDFSGIIAESEYMLLEGKGIKNKHVTTKITSPTDHRVRDYVEEVKETLAELSSEEETTTSEESGSSSEESEGETEKKPSSPDDDLKF